MTRHEAIEEALREIDEECGACHPSHDPGMPWHSVCVIQKLARKALALPENSKVVNSELYGLAVEVADTGMQNDIELLNPYITDTYKLRGNDLQRYNRALRYLSLREASGEPMPYRVVRDGDKVRFE